ncbi:hypothetical protein [Robertmurraya andreesenii]|uniref:Uncharacterized protein n=1 Tax=Anoxybacillus andreesenii TaxID=1325932 RepID=A0ABT9V212_9BACL|nr:hypothetical protein [Robertmurraya andreesenii]MDQ0154983.1 hypothetical protein [Robertmurraya andreesenii]
MNWEQRVKRYLKWFGYEFLEVDGGYVFWKDQKGKVWISSEGSINYKMTEWERYLTQI